MPRSNKHYYMSRLLTGWGSSCHDFAVYVSNRHASKEYISELHSAYLPLMERYTPSAILRIDTGSGTRRLYISADLFPHMPYRSLRELEFDYRKGAITEEEYKRSRNILQRGMQFGVPMPHFVYLYRNNFPGFTVPIQIDPSNGNLLPFVYYPLDMIEKDVRNTVEHVTRKLLRAFFKLLKHVHVVGYVPKYLMENNDILLNLYLLYAYFLPIEINLHEELHERILEIAYARAYTRILTIHSDALFNYYRKNILPHAITTVEEDPTHPGIPAYSAYGTHARMALIRNIADTTRYTTERTAFFLNPFAATLRKLIEDRATIRDILYVSVKDGAVDTYPDNTFSFVSALFQHFTDMHTVQKIVEGNIVLHDNEAYTSYLNSVEVRIAEYLLDQTFPYLTSRDNLEHLRDAYSKYNELIPRSSTKNVLMQTTRYVDDKLINVLSIPSENELADSIS